MLQRWFILLISSLVFIVGCSQTASQEISESSELQELDLIGRITSPAVEVNIRNIPDVDRAKSVVPAEDIYFDTFQRFDRIVPLSDADEALILRLRDAIPPIYNPKFELAESADWMESGDLVVGYAQGDVAVAYPIKILNWHEIVSHDIDGVPILATY